MEATRSPLPVSSATPVGLVRIRNFTRLVSLLIVYGNTDLFLVSILFSYSKIIKTNNNNNSLK